MVYARILEMKNENFSCILKIKILTCKGYPNLKNFGQCFRGRFRGWGVTRVTSQPPPYNDRKTCVILSGINVLVQRNF